ncbi:Group 3 secretory phospholipase A2 [Triplophysa tibetana]|uniref:phospholipase A2 n=1 Tax=Triplophysa tibetana TaxID=1572043 RepID=A0A5A9N539_9TELE|nr:Group 3 secretory phospholipase A2 [Triplophysa tibetana]
MRGVTLTYSHLLVLDRMFLSPPTWNLNLFVTLYRTLSLWVIRYKIFIAVVIVDTDKNDDNTQDNMSYVSRCWDLRSSSFSESPDVRFNIRQLVKPDGPCQTAHNLKGISESVRKARDLRSVDPDGSVQQDHGESSDLKLRRSKRALMIPGTVWCGSGNKASNFSELGMFEETDKCCREHDHCQETIASFSFDHGVFNTNIFTLSHCDCDNRFRHCLSGVNNTVSNIVGYGYFNLLKMRCFEFAHRMKCARRTWCIFSNLTQYAVIKGPTNYTDALPEKDKHILEMSFRQTIMLDDNQVTKTSEASLSIQTNDSRSNSEALSPEPSVTTLWSRKSEPSILPTDTPKTTLPQYTGDRLQKGKFKVCDSYRDLDSCHLQIPALQEKFGLRNSDVRSMYHCNCTKRLRTVRKEQGLYGRYGYKRKRLSAKFAFYQTISVSFPCSCSDSQAEAPVIQHWRKGVTQVRHLVDLNRNFKRMNFKRSKRKDSAVKLRKKCLRMHTKLHRTRVTEQKLL